MGRKRGKSNKWYFPTKEQIQRYKEEEEKFWVGAERDTSWGKVNYYSEEKMDKDHKEKSNEVIAYIVVSKERAENTLSIQDCGLKQSLLTEIKRGYIGTGLYLYENRRYALEVARRERKVVLGCLVDIRNCLDLMQNKGQVEISNKYKQAKLDNRKINDCSIIDEVCKEKKLNSIRSVEMIGNSLYVGSKIYKYMTGVICVKNIEIIKKWYKLDLSK